MSQFSSTQATQDASNTVVIHVEGDPARLYTGHLRAGSRVVLMVETISAAGVTVTFDGGATPFVGCGSAFILEGGAPVDFVVAKDADGEYGFRLESGALSVEGCRLVVTPDGDLDKTGFLVREIGSSLRVSQWAYQRMDGKESLGLKVQASADQLSQVSILQPGGEPQPLTGSEVEVPVTGFGCVATVSLTAKAAPTVLGKGQTGGTEHVEIVVEPPT